MKMMIAMLKILSLCLSLATYIMNRLRGILKAFVRCRGHFSLVFPSVQIECNSFQNSLKVKQISKCLKITNLLFFRASLCQFEGYKHRNRET